MKNKEDHRVRCIFCDAAASGNDAATLIIHRARLNFVILNRYPYNNGHLMIAPYQHASRLQQVDQETVDEMMRLAQLSERIIEAAWVLTQASWLNCEWTAGFLPRPLNCCTPLCQGEIYRKDSTKDKIEGDAHELKGKVKEKVGHAINNPNLETEGSSEKLGGKIQKKVGDIEKVVEK